MANTQFVVNSIRFDPYKNFKFRVKFDGRTVAGISKVSLLKQSTEPVSHREGGDPSSARLTPGIWKFEPITLERGVTHDKEFEDWAKLIWSLEGDAAISLENFRKKLTIELLNEQGAVAKAYNVFRCWVSEYQALPELDANANVVAIEKIVVQNEGWERDVEIEEPQQT
ncbi:MAG: phage tail protein [Chitinophagaceae bacterium]|nr:MAG: phage tail protein [Chitinophagaceae bacterium]